MIITALVYACVGVIYTKRNTFIARFLDDHRTKICTTLLGKSFRFRMFNWMRYSKCKCTLTVLICVLSSLCHLFGGDKSMSWRMRARCYCSFRRCRYGPLCTHTWGRGRWWFLWSPATRNLKDPVVGDGGGGGTDASVGVGHSALLLLLYDHLPDGGHRHTECSTYYNVYIPQMRNGLIKSRGPFEGWS